MIELIVLAKRQFQGLPVVTQRDILLDYVRYVEETVISETGDPFPFLKWYLLLCCDEEELRQHAQPESTGT